jgi:hypothetical protein
MSYEVNVKNHRIIKVYAVVVVVTVVTGVAKE